MSHQLEISNSKDSNRKSIEAMTPAELSSQTRPLVKQSPCLPAPTKTYFGRLVTKSYDTESISSPSMFLVRHLFPSDTVAHVYHSLGSPLSATEMAFLASLGNSLLFRLAVVITTFNVIPSDSPIMHIIRQGNWEDFREMLRNGQASPWDCNENGLSLFKVGTWRPKIKVMLYSLRTS